MHRCHVFGSRTAGASLSVVNCFEHRAGKRSEQTLSGEDYQVDVILRGAPITYVKNMSTTCGVTGTVTKKVNKR